MLYKEKQSLALERSLFENPASQYRGTPFWAWNCKVDKEDVDRILMDLKRMGMGGFHIHCRTGMDIPYLSQEFMELVRYTYEKGRELGMLTWLYDEDRFPSGSAGGMVTKKMEFRQRILVVSPEKLNDREDVFGNPLKEGQRKYFGRYAVWLQEGYLADYKFLESDDKEPAGADIWYLYREVIGDNPWFNDQAYVDTLNAEAVGEFIRLTHETYYKEFANEFGETIPAIFTDEPQFWPKSTLDFAGEKKRVLLPFTDDLPDSFQKASGYHFFEILPECIWELPDGRLSDKRYHFHNHICERFVHGFADQIGAWCRRHGIALTGHMMEEPTLASQTAMLGEAMRSYRAFEIPGIDMLYDSRELNTAKQAQSAVRQYGREGMLSELYGVTGWNFDFRGHKLAGDWQAALGVTVRVHHLTWTSMAGEAKRDYPASIGCQSPWYCEYRFLEDYFARLNTALTRGKSEVKIGVLHPIESYWLYWGPKEQTQMHREEMDEHFRNLTEWLSYGLLDFDFIAESLWQELTPDSSLINDDFLVGKMRYEAIIVPDCTTIRRTSLERLKAFQSKGGKVIFAGKIPAYVDAVVCDDVKQFAGSCEKVTFTKSEILEALENFRIVDIQNQYGVRTNNLLYQMRSDKIGKWLFISHCRKMLNPDLPCLEKLRIKIKGKYHPKCYDAMTGEIREVSFQYVGGHTIVMKDVYDHDSLLYYLKDFHQVEDQTSMQDTALEIKEESEVVLSDKFEVFLEEPNVLVLDMAEFKLDEGEWQKKEEILRIDNMLRRKLGYPLRTEAFSQPWIDQKPEKIEHFITLRFSIWSDTEVRSALLALENREETELYLNGEKVSGRVNGYYVDRAIKTVPVPGLHTGENILVARMPYYHRFSLEAMYLLGDFGVKAAGKNTRIIETKPQMAFGDICMQGLPFYGGNLTYKIPVTLEETCDLKIKVTQFRSPFIKVRMDGKDCGGIGFSPYELVIPEVALGEHLLELTACGSRVNTFGALHNCNQREPWPGHPDSYRTSGAAWAYEYQLKPAGILVSPVITSCRNT